MVERLNGIEKVRGSTPLISTILSRRLGTALLCHILSMRAKAKVSGSVVAGFPSPAEQYQEPPLDLNELLVKRPAATYFVRVEGDSMVGAGISDGDLLVVDRSLRPANGDVIIASVDGDFTVKTYRRDKDGVRLEPANPNYPVIRLRPGQELDYFGKVTACIHRFAGKR